jgi:hypothetical protein
MQPWPIATHEKEVAMRRLLMPLAFLLITGSIDPVQAEQSGNDYVFGWPFVERDLSPRGGTTRGPDVTLDTNPSSDFECLNEPGLSDFERDRRAILSMAGTYRVSFDFLEVVGFAPGFEPARPYRSWATERVYVVSDSGNQIVLQHILIMSVVGEDGQVMGPFVTKHWRQDWVYENPEVHTYRGHATWAREQRSEEERSGHWSQTVWQVDDSPRYAAWGRWEHTPERSSWTGGETWRPLPMRELSVRDDYDVLIATNTHIVLPSGWVHEEHNVKAVLTDDGLVDSRLAREMGLARYERLRDFDTRAGDEYQEATADFWAEVRAYWAGEMDRHDRIELASTVEGRRLFEVLFERAQAIADGDVEAAESIADFVEQSINAFRTDTGSDAGG